MEIKESIKGQYHAALAMLRQAIERCPEGLWSGDHQPRKFWRIAYHALFYTEVYLQPNEESLQGWAKPRGPGDLWNSNKDYDPMPKAEMLTMLEDLDREINTLVDHLDLESNQSGFSWYPKMNKLDHQLMNLRHLQGHIGQLSEILLEKNIDTDWYGLTPETKNDPYLYSV